MTTDVTHFPKEFFDKRDTSDDELFYRFPRKVVHIDDQAIHKVRYHFRALLPAGGNYLDLMSSWRSHIPAELNPAHVSGLGMNADEMADNPQLNDYVVHNLNKDPCLPYDDATFDGAICTVSVQYLTAPVEVFSDVARVLKPSAPFIVTFSNRCFPTKAIAVWVATSDTQHVALVADYFQQAGLWQNINSHMHTPRNADPLYAVWGFKQA